ncbi:lipid II flippase MurJ [Galbitalea sp. SE-J8]|uniref:murein biosynthesis integral membrane protein MurJ n=1 Tax=Galbitalea sp. SE-J8 TaxID=3054952 RepID=UPI00259C8ABE|nr:lipid II flippase MurJ [Galbitalea sp. SE-J8]MDM4762338.1 lipid II flippase MurJ [Galbitalea sp. SE-J8]
MSGGLGRASALFASGTIVSRLLGFVSLVLLSQTLGTRGEPTDLFGIANQLPNNVYAIVAGGLFSAVFVPAIVRAGVHSDGGQAFVNRLVTLGLVVFTALGVAATLAAPALVRVYASPTLLARPGADDLLTAFACWCLPQVLFYALYSLFGEVLNARGVFGPFTWVPALNNVVAIAGLVVFRVAFDLDAARASAEAWTPAMVAVLAGSATLGVAVQAFGLLFFWRRTGLGFRPDFHWRGAGLGAAGRAAIWTFGMVLITQLAGVVQTQVSSSASGDDASVRVLGNTWLVFMLPHSIAAVSIGTAYFTRMATHSRDGRLGALRDDIGSSLNAIGLVLVFSAIGLIVLSFPFSAVFASHGWADVTAMAPVLIAFLVGLVPFSVLFAVRRIFYALDDTRTPFWLTVAQAVVFVLLVLLVPVVLPTDAVALGIAIVTTVAGTLQTGLGLVLLRRKLGHLRGRVILRRHVQFAVAALPAAIVGLLAVWALGGLHAGGFGVSSPLGGITTVVVGGGLMALVYAAVLRVMHNPQLDAIIGPVLRRIRR